MHLYFLTVIFSVLLPAVKISAFTIPVNQSITTNPLNDNSTSNILPTNYQCVKQATWFSKGGFSKGFDDDCEEAWDVMDVSDLLRYDGGTLFEFLSSDATPSSSSLKPMRTPRRYTYGRSNQLT